MSLLPLIPFTLVLSALVGVVGRKRTMGFWGYFFASIVLTPVIGILLVLVSPPLADVNPSK